MLYLTPGAVGLLPWPGRVIRHSPPKRHVEEVVKERRVRIRRPTASNDQAPFSRIGTLGGMTTAMNKELS